MRRLFLFPLLALILGRPSFAADIRLFLASRQIVIEGAQFIRQNAYKSFVPELRFTVLNDTDSFWNNVKLQFEVEGVCNFEPRKWSLPASLSLTWAEGYRLRTEYRDTVISLVGKVDGCKAETIQARIVSAENVQVRIDASGASFDLKAEADALRAKREAEHDIERAASAAKREQEAEAQAAEEKADRERVAAAQRKAAIASAAVRKREVEAANARAARLAKLPWVNSGGLSAFIASDRKCAEQFQQALAMDGLEKRKHLADLLSYGCGFLADSPVHAELLQKDGNYALVKLAEGKQDGRSGWVPVAWMK